MISYVTAIKNLPEHKKEGFVVARVVDNDLWYYGTYETKKKASEVAKELGFNAVVIYAREIIK